MKPTNYAYAYAYACSMKLGDNPEMARERYESLRSELIKIGYEEKGKVTSIPDCIRLDGEGGFYEGWSGMANARGPLLPYNRALFLAIAGQKVGGGVGCWYKMLGRFSRELLKMTARNKHSVSLVSQSGKEYDFLLEVFAAYHLATIAELIEAFPNEPLESYPPDDRPEESYAYCADMEANSFRSELSKAINKYSKENGSNTPDFIIAKFLESSLAAFDVSVNERTDWYHQSPNSEAFPNPTCEENAQVEKGSQAKDDWRNNPCMSRYERRIKLEAEVKKLKDFKDYVHWRLDQAGIPTHPDGEHSKAGCRIGDRLDIALHHANENVLETDLISDEDIARALVEPKPRKVNPRDMAKHHFVNKEAEPVKEERDWTEEIKMSFNSERLNLYVNEKGIFHSSDDDVDAAPFLRAVLAKYDELKSL